VKGGELVVEDESKSAGMKASGEESGLAGLKPGTYIRKIQIANFRVEQQKEPI
jgi:hypothetical protein